MRKQTLASSKTNSTPRWEKMGSGNWLNNKRKYTFKNRRSTNLVCFRKLVWLTFLLKIRDRSVFSQPWTARPAIWQISSQEIRGLPNFMWLRNVMRRVLNLWNCEIQVTGSKIIWFDIIPTNEICKAKARKTNKISKKGKVFKVPIENRERSNKKYRFFLSWTEVFKIQQNIKTCHRYPTEKFTILAPHNSLIELFNLRT